MEGLPMTGKDFEERKRIATKALKNHKNYIPVYIRKSAQARISDPPKNEFLVGSNTTIGVLIFKIRKNIKLSPEEGLFLFIDNCIPSTSALIGDLYKQYCKEDLHLHITYTDENVYG